MESGIYYIKVRNKYYIGQSKNVLRRIKEHKMEALRSDKRLYKAMRTYGYSWGIIEYCKPQQLDNREIHWITEWDTFRGGYNETLGGKYSFRSSVKAVGRKWFWEEPDIGGEILC